MSDKGNVYWIGPDAPEAVKVGWTAKHPALRLENLQLGNPRRLRIIGFVEGGKELESCCHELLAAHHIRGEWFEREAALDLLIELGPGGRPSAAFKRFEARQT